MRISIWLLFLCSCVSAGQPVGISPTALSQGESLQAVIDRGGPLVYVPKGVYQLDTPLKLRSNLTLFVESGTAIEAAVGAFQGKEDSLIVIAGMENVTIAAEGATFKMRKDDYRDATKYPIKSEFRHCLDIRGSKNVTITGGTFADSGGDGIYLGPLILDDPAWANSKRHIPNESIVIRRVTCDNNFRQGISVVACVGCLIEDSMLARTNGTSPQAGIDVEPEYQDPIDVTIRRCKSVDNRGPAFMWSLQNVALTYRANNVTVNTPPVRIIMEGNTYDGVPLTQPTLRMTGIFRADPPTGYLAPNIPPGSTLQWDSLTWKK